MSSNFEGEVEIRLKWTPEPTLFEQTALKVQSQEMRLLKVLPELIDGQVYCEMRHARLDSDNYPRFDALSYMWGPEHPRRPMLVNGRPFSVRENLWDFLNIARETRPHQWLWIDALSIAQANKDEKEQQIRLMRDVFKSAEQVLIWLGSGNEAIESLMRLSENDELLARIGLVRAQRDGNNQRMLAKLGRTSMPFMCNHFESHYSRNLQRIDPEITENDADNLDKFLSNHCRSEQDFWGAIGRVRDDLYFGDDVLLLGTYALDQHPYWSRVWIIQEVFLSSKRKLLHGKWELSWDQYDDIMQLFLPMLCKSHSLQEIRCRNNCYAYLNSQKNSHGFAHLREARNLHSCDVAAILQQFKRTHCTVAHDHIYGVLALSEIVRSFPVDYDSSMVELLLNALLFCLTDSYVRDPNSQVAVPGSYFNSPGRSNFGNYLASKIRWVSPERTKGSFSLFEPTVVFSVIEPLSGPWKTLTISSLLQWFRYKRSSLATACLPRSLLTVFTEHIDASEQIFASNDVVFYDLHYDIILIIREMTSERRVVGRATSERTFNGCLDDSEVGHPGNIVMRWKTSDMILDLYGPNGLHGAVVHDPTLEDTYDSPTDIACAETFSNFCDKHSFVADEAFLESYVFGDSTVQFDFQRECYDCPISEQPQLATIYFTDIRAAIILFMLPDNQAMRAAAISMLAEKDVLDCFEDIECFALSNIPGSIVEEARNIEKLVERPEVVEAAPLGQTESYATGGCATSEHYSDMMHSDKWTLVVPKGINIEFCHLKRADEVSAKCNPEEES